MIKLSLFSIAAVFTLFSGCTSSSQPAPDNETKAAQAIRENRAEAEEAQKEYIKLQRRRNGRHIAYD